jgi:hypothetical protein
VYGKNGGVSENHCGKSETQQDGFGHACTHGMDTNIKGQIKTRVYCCDNTYHT